MSRGGICAYAPGRSQRAFFLDTNTKPSNSFSRRRSITLRRHVADMIVMEAPAQSAGDDPRLSYSIRITAKTTIKTV
ncbi:hypothetical protein G6L35_13395 [Agrobacterium tumefaciens]|nr:hypothetical protein [Agrobacterium tumefaciens]NSY69858.1 hypothetical protein [Agrobacterium tumefaciens]NSZ22578.1 hypothetical protein [Agrobacterium tumefaciens]NSZ69627.1 hypothetical protein [Agrobacterium tumefaciens]NTB18667.1 hypothetical protein [Agrobacterium tumefaciens]